MIINLPEKVKYIIEEITGAGYEAYAVGGCIRDSILGREPNDWDITTSARPQQVKELFRRTIDTGIAHGTVTVMLDKEGYEVTTYRIDGEYEDHRHPRNVQFTSRLVEDLRRRDFTINAMAYNDTAGLVDAFDGMGDIERGVIRCVGCARDRFGEDALRMLRAIRFSAQLGYDIEEETGQAIRELAPSLSAISAERIQTELVKLLISPHPDYLRQAYELGVTAVVLPELDRCMETPQKHPHHCYTVGEHILHSLGHVPAEKELRLAMLLHDIGKPRTLEVDQEGITHFYGHPSASAKMSQEILRRLRFDNDTIVTVCRLVEYHDYGNNVEPAPATVRRAMNRIGGELFPRLLQVKRADIMAQSDYRREAKLELVDAWEREYQDIVKQGQCVSLKDLAVSGRDLVAAGMLPGRELGELLQRMLMHVLEFPDDNTREKLFEIFLKVT
ncbi:MAG: CCA tRNA nucleotidyltransferase [bacterium]|nr:CCA tRNA nucleotidyltransferase [bacterium]MCM1374465.1 CCA tRNA nucleotidyltransferase [Muribaculum sp.]